MEIRQTDLWRTEFRTNGPKANRVKGERILGQTNMLSLPTY